MTKAEILHSEALLTARTLKTIHFSVPKEVYAEFHKLCPLHGDKAHFLRQAIIQAIRNADKRDHFASVKLGKEVRDE